MATAFVAGQLEADLAVGIDVLNDDFEIVAQRHDILDPIDPAASSELGDVYQTVTARKDVDKRPE